MGWNKVAKKDTYLPLIYLLTPDLKGILVGGSETEQLIIQRENDAWLKISKNLSTWNKTVKNLSSWNKVVKPTI